MACTCTVCNHIQETNNYEDHHDGLWNRHDIICFSVAAVFFIIGIILKIASEPFKMSVQFGGVAYTIALSSLFFIGSWLAAGLEVLRSLLKTIGKGSIFDENFLMTFATIGAFLLGNGLRVQRLCCFTTWVSCCKPPPFNSRGVLLPT